MIGSIIPPKDLIERVDILEGANYEFRFWRQVSTTTGTITKPTGSTILLDRWPADIDAVVSVVTAGEVPDEENAYTSGGEIISTTLNTDGDFVLSDTPSSYPVAIIGRASCPAAAWKAMIASGEILLGFKKMDPTTELGYYFVPAGAMIPATTAGAEPATVEYGTNDQDYDAMLFDSGATEERVQFPAVLRYWDGGPINAIHFWSSDTGSTSGDTVEWGTKGVAIGDSDPLDVAQGTPQVISDALTADDGADLQITAMTPDITIGGSGVGGELINLENYRNTDGTDDMAEDARLFGTLIIYTKSVVQD